MYTITDYSYKKAKQIGVIIKPSQKKNKKIDVYNLNGEYITSVGMVCMIILRILNLTVWNMQMKDEDYFINDLGPILRKAVTYTIAQNYYGKYFVFGFLSRFV